MLPGLWLNEGGQSATGALLDHVLDLHAEGRKLGGEGHETVVAHILRRKAEDPAYARDLLLLPDFHGNRSPLADPVLRGTIHGLALDSSFESLARLYHAAAVGIVYGTRHILDTLGAHGYRIARLHLTGGHARNPLLVQLYADATRCDVVLPREPDGVLLGTALAAAVACGAHADLPAAGRAMVHDGRRIAPDAREAAFHDRGYAAFRRMIEQRERGARLSRRRRPGRLGSSRAHLAFREDDVADVDRDRRRDQRCGECLRAGERRARRRAARSLGTGGDGLGLEPRRRAAVGPASGRAAARARGGRAMGDARRAPRVADALSPRRATCASRAPRTSAR
jgi:hypothetical protein